ncbi:MAG: O-antigen ligase family protein [Nodosilinea sp.]
MKKYLPWLLLSLFCFLVSLSKPFVHGLEPPALVIPLQQLREYGRILSLAALGALAYVTLGKKAQFFRTSTPKPLQYLWILQGVIFCKAFLFGDSQTALLLFLTYTFLIWVMRRGVLVWIYRDGFDAANLSMITVAVIFVVLNTCQALISTAPLTVINGQFSGTTNNPQMLVITLVPLIPCLLFKLEDKSSSKLGKAFFIATLVVMFYFVWWSASRTGLIMAVASVIFFYRFRQGPLFRTAAILALVAAFILPYFSPTLLSGGDGSLSMLGKLQGGTDTRTEVWQTLLNSFYENPLFGTPIQGGRLGFGENTWLSVAATTGLIGLLPLLLFAYEALKMIIKLLTISRRQSVYAVQCNTVIAGIVTIFVGSFFEALILGVLTTPILALLIFLLLGNYIIYCSYQFPGGIPILSPGCLAPEASPR